MKVDFLNDQEKIKCSAYFTNFSRKDYEDSTNSANFSVKWTKLKIAKEGKRKLGQIFWREYEVDCPYTGLVCKKQ